MNVTTKVAVLAACLFAMSAVSAYAQATRTFVSGVGDDANPCSRTAPCKTFAGSISKTATGGEINVLDPGGFGALTITKSITIRSDHVEAGVLVAGTDGIDVNIPAGSKVVLQGLDFEGLGSGLNGINVLGGGTLTIDRCDIRDFTGNGVNIGGSTGAGVFINTSRILNNAGGVSVENTGGTTNKAFITNSLIDGNTNFAVQASTNGTLYIENDQLTRSTAAIAVLNNGSVISYGGNLLRGTGMPTGTMPLQ